MKLVMKLAISLVTVILVIGCSTPRDQLKETGLFGEHTLASCKSLSASTNSVSGSFFLSCGSVSAADSDLKLQLYWSPNPGEIIASAMPYSKFRFVIDETKSTPTVEFMFHPEWLNSAGGRYCIQNLNDFVLSDFMQVAVVKISSATLEKEVYLPKFAH